ncbi:hypothetical protein D3C87_1409810 [compost metagenome]
MQGRIPLAAVAHRHVHAGVLQQVDRVRAGLQVQLILRIGLVKAPKARHQPQRRKGMRGGQGQRARCGFGTQGIQRLGNLQQGAMHAGEQARAAVGQAHASRHAVKQRHAHLAFQQFDLVRHRRGRHGQFRRGQLETPQPGGRLEGAQCGNGQGCEHGFQAFL